MCKSDRAGLAKTVVVPQQRQLDWPSERERESGRTAVWCGAERAAVERRGEALRSAQSLAPQLSQHVRESLVGITARESLAGKGIITAPAGKTPPGLSRGSVWLPRQKQEFPYTAARRRLTPASPRVLPTPASSCQPAIHNAVQPERKNPREAPWPSLQQCRRPTCHGCAPRLSFAVGLLASWLPLAIYVTTADACANNSPFPPTASSRSPTM